MRNTRPGAIDPPADARSRKLRTLSRETETTSSLAPVSRPPPFAAARGGGAATRAASRRRRDDGEERRAARDADVAEVDAISSRVDV